MPPNSMNPNRQVQGPPPPPSQQQQQQHPSVSGRSPIQRQMVASGGQPQDAPATIPDQFQQEINTRIIKRNLGNAAIIRILDLIDFISNQQYENLSSIEFWTKITPANFLPSAILKFNTINTSGSNTGSNNLSIHDITGLNLNFLKINPNNNGNGVQQFELNTSTAPRFFVSCVKAKNILKCNINMSGSKFQVLNNGSIIIVSKIELNFGYQDGSNSVIRGAIKILMSRDLRIEWIDLNCSDYQSNISIQALEPKLKSLIDTKKDLKKQKELVDEILSSSHAVQAGLTSGIDSQSMRILQIGDIMTSMKSLMEFSMVNNISSPLKSLELLISSQNSQPISALQAQMAAQSHFQAIGSSGNPNSQQQLNKNNNNNNNNNNNSGNDNGVSSPSPRTIVADDSKKKRKPSMSSLNDGKRRK
ncbi:MFG1 Morphogenetic regulator of filamentous growth protein 1 [Candida maltosa Xu316]